MTYREIFINEYRVRMNQAIRLGASPRTIPPLFVTHTKSLSPVKNGLFGFAYGLVCLLGLLVLLLRRRAVPTTATENIFIFTDARLKKFAPDDYRPAVVGLHKVLSSEPDEHLYFSLPRRSILRAISSAAQFRREARRELHRTAEKHQIPATALTHGAIGVPFRALDVLLAEQAISARERVATAGHFDIYTALASQLRLEGEVGFIKGYQHGLYELFVTGPPQRLWFDEYVLKGRNSIQFFESHLSSNSDCVAYTQEGPAPFSDYRCSLEPSIALALQADNDREDDRLISNLLEITEAYKVDLIAYLHPSTSRRRERFLVKKFPLVQIERTRRYRDVSLVVTRYSTLAADYLELGTPAIFAGTDETCLAHSASPLVGFAKTQEELRDLVCQKLDEFR